MKITLSELSTKNLATLASRTIAISDKPGYAIVKENPLLLKLRKAAADYDDVYSKKSFSGLGTDVAMADRRRDIIFSGIKTVLLGHTKDSDSLCHKESKDVYAIIEKYGIGLDRYSYSEETAQLNKLIQELGQPVNLAKIEKANLTDNLSRLIAAEASFEEIYAQQVTVNAGLRQMESATSIRGYLERALKNYFRMVISMKDETDWNVLYAELNEAVKDARNSNKTASHEQQVTMAVAK
jgi:hypothetical protein